jgi:hypothetical protein
MVVSFAQAGISPQEASWIVVGSVFVMMGQSGCVNPFTSSLGWKANSWGKLAL